MLNDINICLQKLWSESFSDCRFLYRLSLIPSSIFAIVIFQEVKVKLKICRCLFLNCNIRACNSVCISVEIFEQVSFLRIKCNNGECSCTTKAEVDMFIYIVVHTSLLISFLHAILSWLLIIPIKYKVNQPEKTFTFCL